MEEEEEGEGQSLRSGGRRELEKPSPSPDLQKVYVSGRLPSIETFLCGQQEVLERIDSISTNASFFTTPHVINYRIASVEPGSSVAVSQHSYVPTTETKVVLYDTERKVPVVSLGATMGPIHGLACVWHSSSTESSSPRVISGGIDSTIRVFHSADGTLLQSISCGPQFQIRRLYYSGDRRVFASGMTPNAVLQCDLEKETIVQKFEGYHSDVVTDVRCAHSSSSLFSISNDSTVRVWDLRSGRAGAMLLLGGRGSSLEVKESSSCWSYVVWQSQNLGFETVGSAASTAHSVPD